MEAEEASATSPPARTAAWAIHLAYPVALESTVATEIESTDDSTLRLAPPLVSTLPSVACQPLPSERRHKRRILPPRATLPRARLDGSETKKAHRESRRSR